MKKLIATIAVLGIAYASWSLLFQLWFVATMHNPESLSGLAPEGASNPSCSLEPGATFQLGRFPYFVRERFIWLPEGCGPEPAPVREHVLFGGLFLSMFLSVGVLGTSVVAVRALVRYARTPPLVAESKSRGGV